MRRLSPFAGAAAVALPPLAALALLAGPLSPSRPADADGLRAASVPGRASAPAALSRRAEAALLRLDPGTSATIRSTRRVASRQLAVTRRRVAGCAGSPAPDCDLWPLAHAAVASRANAAILANAANGLPTGDCRARALGAAATFRILAGEADGLVLSRHDGSAGSRARRAERRATVLGLIGYARHLLVPAGWRACVPGAGGGGPAA